MKKDSHIYTTIQVRKDMNSHIRQFCKEYGLLTSAVTEQMWSQLISSSVSGSIVLWR